MIMCSCRQQHPPVCERGKCCVTVTISDSNVALLPHLAGSMDGETARMGQCMVEELDRWLAGGPLKWEVTRDRFATMA